MEKKTISAITTANAVNNDGFIVLLKQSLLKFSVWQNILYIYVMMCIVYHTSSSVKLFFKLLSPNRYMFTTSCSIVYYSINECFYTYSGGE